MTGAWATLFILLAIYVTSYIDRQAMGIVVEFIKTDLSLSDTNIGFLQGFIFTTILVVFSIPLSWFVDNYNRRRMLTLCVSLFALATIGCGLAHSFAELAIARGGLALAEAIVPAAAMSLIGDVFPRQRVGSAIAIFLSGGTIGSGLAFMGGGAALAALDRFAGYDMPLIGKFEPWRGLFILLGTMTLLLALVTAFWLREPSRQQDGEDSVGWATVGSLMRQKGTYITYFIIFAAALAMTGYSLYAWSAAMLIRVHQLSTFTTGMIVGPMFVVASLVGAAVSAWSSARAGANHALRQVLKTMVWAVAGMFPLFVALPYMNAVWAAVVLCGLLLLYAIANVSFLTPVQLITPPRLRGRMTAVVSTMCVIPAGLGPVLVGMVTDRVIHDPAGLDKALSWVLSSVLLIGVAGGVAAYRQARIIEEAPKGA